MKKERIIMHTELNSGIYRDDRERWAAQDATFADGPRGRLQAARALRRRRAELVRSFGGVGAGITTLTLDDEDISDELLLELELKEAGDVGSILRLLRR